MTVYEASKHNLIFFLRYALLFSRALDEVEYVYFDVYSFFCFQGLKRPVDYKESISWYISLFIVIIIRIWELGGLHGTLLPHLMLLRRALLPFQG